MDATQREAILKDLNERFDPISLIGIILGALGALGKIPGIGWIFDLLKWFIDFFCKLDDELLNMLKDAWQLLLRAFELLFESVKLLIEVVRRKLDAKYPKPVSVGTEV